MNTAEAILIQIDALTDGRLDVIKTDSKTYEYHFVPKGCKCGGVVGVDSGFNSYEEALASALVKAVRIDAQGWHSHGGAKKTKNAKR